MNAYNIPIKKYPIKVLVQSIPLWDRKTVHKTRNHKHTTRSAAIFLFPSLAQLATYSDVANPFAPLRPVRPILQACNSRANIN